jgi:hypothetical protein
MKNVHHFGYVRYIMLTFISLSLISVNLSAYQVTIYNQTPDDINVSLGKTFGEAAKIKKIPAGKSADTDINFDIVKGKVKVYYTSDPDFKYHFMSSEPSPGWEKLIEPITKFKPRNIYISPNKIEYDQTMSKSSTGLSKLYTVCKPCKIDYHAADKVKAYYNS